MTTAHTPGPWSVGPHPGNGAGDDWRTILADTPEFGPLYIAEAALPDACLIAAAPDLLAALKSFVIFETDPPAPGTFRHDLHAHARAAITKAGG